MMYSNLCLSFRETVPLNLLKSWATGERTSGSVAAPPQRRQLGQQRILLWTSWWSEPARDWFLGSGTEPFAACPVNNCHLTGMYMLQGKNRILMYFMRIRIQSLG